MNIDLALNAINDELLDKNNSSKVIEHYLKLLKAINMFDPPYKGMKILVFHPCCTGDIIESSLSAELFHIKFPGCIVDYLVDHPMSTLIKSNPFINKVHTNPDWNIYKKRDSLEEGEFKKQYDMAYSLYWWSKPNAIRSFLEDLELPTDYTRLRLYKTTGYEEKIKSVLPPKDNKFFICLQEKQDIASKWNVEDGRYEKLKEELEKLGHVILVGPSFQGYLEGIELFRNCDFFIGAHGSLEHAAAAVGCQCITISTVYDPNYVAVQSYQNDYLPENRHHISIRPENWCGNYRCIDLNNITGVLTPHNPPYGFSTEGRFPPHIYKNCDYNGLKKSCTYEISVDLIIKHVKIALEKRGL